MASIKVTSILVNLASTAVLLNTTTGNVEMDCNDNIFPASEPDHMSWAGSVCWDVFRPGRTQRLGLNSECVE